MLHIAPDRDTTVISQAGLRIPEGRRVQHGWNAMVEARAPRHPAATNHTPGAVAPTILPPLVAGLVAIRYLPPLSPCRS